MKTALILAALVSLSACSSSHKLAMPEGDWIQLNQGKWAYNPNDLTTPPITPTTPTTQASK